MSPNNALVSDAMSAVLCKGHLARAGGCERWAAVHRGRRT